MIYILLAWKAYIVNCEYIRNTDFSCDLIPSWIYLWDLILWFVLSCSIINIIGNDHDHLHVVYEYHMYMYEL